MNADLPVIHSACGYPGRDAGGVGPGAASHRLVLLDWRQYHWHLYICIHTSIWIILYLNIFMAPIPLALIYILNVLFLFRYIHGVYVGATHPVIHSACGAPGGMQEVWVLVPIGAAWHRLTGASTTCTFIYISFSYFGYTHICIYIYIYISCVYRRYPTCHPL